MFAMWYVYIVSCCSLDHSSHCTSFHFLAFSTAQLNSSWTKKSLSSGADESVVRVIPLFWWQKKYAWQIFIDKKNCLVQEEYKSFLGMIHCSLTVWCTATSFCCSAMVDGGDDSDDSSIYGTVSSSSVPCIYRVWWRHGSLTLTTKVLFLKRLQTQFFGTKEAIANSSNTASVPLHWHMRRFHGCPNAKAEGGEDLSNGSYVCSQKETCFLFPSFSCISSHVGDPRLGDRGNSRQSKDVVHTTQEWESPETDSKKIVSPRGGNVLMACPHIDDDVRDRQRTDAPEWVVCNAWLHTLYGT